MQAATKAVATTPALVALPRGVRARPLPVPKPKAVKKKLRTPGQGY